TRRVSRDIGVGIIVDGLRSHEGLIQNVAMRVGAGYVLHDASNIVAADCQDRSGGTIAVEITEDRSRASRTVGIRVLGGSTDLVFLNIDRSPYCLCLFANACSLTGPD